MNPYAMLVYNLGLDTGWCISFWKKYEDFLARQLNLFDVFFFFFLGMEFGFVCKLEIQNWVIVLETLLHYGIFKLYPLQWKE